MMKRTFHYCATHREDEAYMQKMSAEGWAARSLVEGFWTFEPCQPGEYCYRICYLRGKSAREVEALKQEYATRGIRFVSRYSFWAIFRSREAFELYTPAQELEICRKIYAPMPIGAVLSWALFAAGVFLAGRYSPFFWIPTALIGLYGAMCTWLAVSYRKLLNRMKH